MRHSVTKRFIVVLLFHRLHNFRQHFFFLPFPSFVFVAYRFVSFVAVKWKVTKTNVHITRKVFTTEIYHLLLVERSSLCKAQQRQNFHGFRIRLLRTERDKYRSDTENKTKSNKQKEATYTHTNYTFIQALLWNKMCWIVDRETRLQFRLSTKASSFITNNNFFGQTDQQWTFNLNFIFFYFKYYSNGKMIRGKFPSLLHRSIAPNRKSLAIICRCSTTSEKKQYILFENIKCAQGKWTEEKPTKINRYENVISLVVFNSVNIFWSDIFR